MDQGHQLLYRCQRGDADALDELIRRWEKRLFYYVRRLLPCEADAWDVLQQTWIRVVKSIGTVREPDRVPAWLYRIARNTAMTHRSSLIAQARHVDPSMPIESMEADTLDDSNASSAADVHRAMDGLSVAHREVLTLFYLRDLTIDDIASVLAVSPGTVKSRLFYAKIAIRPFLAEMRNQP